MFGPAFVLTKRLLPGRRPRQDGYDRSRIGRGERGQLAGRAHAGASGAGGHWQPAGHDGRTISDALQLAPSLLAANAWPGAPDHEEIWLWDQCGYLVLRDPSRLAAVERP
jgi:hypothetical protein